MLNIKRNMLKWMLITTAILLVQLSLITVSVAAPRMKDLGTLGGKNSQAYYINNNRQVVGDSDTADGKTHAFIWENGKMTDLGTLGGSNSKANEINDKGQVVGYSDISGSKAVHAFIWENGKMTDLGTLGGSNSKANGINEKGQVVGESNTAEGKTHAFIWENGKMTDLGTLVGEYSSASKINENGQIALYLDPTIPSWTCHAGKWENGEITDIGASAGYMSWANGINDKGQVIGSECISGPELSCMWENGEIINLYNSEEISSRAVGINNNGQIVGFVDTKPGYHAFIWKNGTATDLGVLGGYCSVGNGINDKGQVVGESSISNDGPFHAFIWEDVTDNSIAPDTASFNLSSTDNITIQIGKNSDTLISVKNGTSELTSKDYSISGSAVTINGSYLSSVFNNLDADILTLRFDFKDGNDPVLNISRVHSIKQETSIFDLSNPQDIKAIVSGYSLKAIKNGSADLKKDVDYSISGNTITIKKSYLIYFFTKFNAPWQKLNLVFDFEIGNDPLFTVTPIPITNFVFGPVFDPSNTQDISVNISGNTLSAVKNGTASLNSQDYSVSGNTVTIKRSYLNYFFTRFTDPWVKLNLTFDFEKGNDPLFTIYRKTN